MNTLFQRLCSQRTETPLLVGEVGQGGPVDALVKRFGYRWRNTPAKGCWCLLSDGMQFTVMAYRDRWDVAFYEYATIAEFKKAFEDKTHVGNAIYFQTEAGVNYTGLAILRFLEERGISLS